MERAPVLRQGLFGWRAPRNGPFLRGWYCLELIRKQALVPRPSEKPLANEGE